HHPSRVAIATIDAGEISSDLPPGKISATDIRRLRVRAAAKLRIRLQASRAILSSPYNRGIINNTKLVDSKVRNYTMDLARFAASLNSKALPRSLYGTLPIIGVDIITAVLTGMVKPVYKSSTEALTTIHGNSGPQSVAAIDGLETTIFGAMYLNGTAAGALQIEHVVLNAHPSSSVLPALLVYASTRNTNTSGEDFLTALAAGYEGCARIGLASCSSVEDERGFKNPAINGQLAMAAAVGNLLSWDAATIASAMGLAASSSGGLVAFQTTDAQTK
ncbi:hypothetical protein CTAM01_03181, partial [Colletotrichum tamarilloi]